MELTAQNVYGLLLRSRLLAPEAVRELFDRWQKEAGGPAAGGEAFLRWAVAAGYLTEYQAGLLRRRHADGFFLDQYRILDRLGRGRMAGVYKAVHESGQVVAIKVLPPSKAKDPPLLARFQREARLALKLKHPNVVRTFQVGQAGELHYLVMEHLEGETLDEVLQRRGPLPPAEAVRLAYQGLLGLQHVHEQGLVHRDLKPANLMLVGASADTTLGGTVKILDIGLGRALFEDAGPDKAPAGPDLTMQGVLLGTPDYMSPEQARDPHGIDIRSDVYSLGCVLYHTLTGQPPFPDTNLLSQMIRHAREEPRPLKDFNPTAPDGLQQILNWMLAKDPAGRYPTPERAAQALQVFLAAGTETTAEAEADPRMRSYLNWLEGADRGSGQTVSATARVKPPSGTVPAAPARPPAGTLPAFSSPARPSPPAAPAVTPAPKPPARSEAKRPRARKPNRPPNAAAPAVPAAEALDVELVPARPGSPGPVAEENGWQLTRRDLLMFSGGVVGTLLAIGVAWLLARLFSPRAQPPSSPPSGDDDSARE